LSQPHYESGTGNLVGPDGSTWREIKAWLEPDEVAEWSRQVPLIVIDECETWSWGAGLTPEVMAQVVTTLESHRLAKGKHSGNVILAASLWELVRGSDRLILLSEEVAKRKKVIKEMLEEHPDIRPGAV